MFSTYLPAVETFFHSRDIFFIIKLPAAGSVLTSGSFSQLLMKDFLFSSYHYYCCQSCQHDSRHHETWSYVKI